MAKLTRIDAVKKPTLPARVKVECACEGTDDGPAILFRLAEWDNGLVEVECSDCFGDLPPYLHPEAVDRMIKAAVEAALAEHEATVGERIAAALAEREAQISQDKDGPNDQQGAG